MHSNTGSCYVVANQAGNSTYAAAPTVNETVSAVAVVVKVAPTVTFTGAPAAPSTVDVHRVGNDGELRRHTDHHDDDGCCLLD